MGEEGMIRKLVSVAAVLALSACAATPPASPSAPPPKVIETPTVPVPPPPAPDSCHSQDFQYLVGKNRSAIPVPTDPSRRRVACTTCPVTMDYNPERLNIFFDSETGVIKEVKCG
jgi:hypothetical protein